MKHSAIFVCLVIHISCINGQTPIRLHPDNPHYFLFRGNPTVLVTSAEHYGIILNSELDYKTYLDKLQQYGFNQTRVFSGAYCEGNEYDFERGKIYQWEDMQNTLSPRPGKFLTPWNRSTEPGYVNGGNKFDLNVWDQEYFRRLKSFCSEAASREIVVEFVFFSANYSPRTWLNSPLNALNNINDVGEVPYNEFHLLKHKALIDHQKKMVVKIVTELNQFDNVYFEICNEPYWMKGIPNVEPSVKEQQFLPEMDEWQSLLTESIVKTEASLPKKHLIAQNFANTYLNIQKINDPVSVINFHYAFPPRAVTDNYQWNRPVAFDETADGCNAPNRRTEAWAFMMAGGAVYSNLDWSFSSDDMTGLGRNPSGKRQSGYEVREQLQILHSTLKSFDFIHSKPVDDVFRQGIPEGVLLYGLTVEGTDYIFYLLKRKKLSFNKWACKLPKGRYEVKFIDPVDGQVVGKKNLSHDQIGTGFDLPLFSDDIAIRMSVLK
jgi:hypothetical protein